MRLIDADALIEAYDRTHEGEPGKARQLILDAPTIEERKPGKWIDGKELHGIIERYCSECGQLVTSAKTVRMSFCPKCGAKMEASNGRVV